MFSLFIIGLCFISIQNEVIGSSKIRSFPPRFLFGAATASYQVEGGWDADGRTPSIWDHLTHTNTSFTTDSSNGDISADSYHLYKEDVKIIKDLGMDFYRFSISWNRILPSGFSNEINEAGVKYYDNIINELLSKGIEPLVTIYHWDLPQKLQELGGFANPLIADWFEDYAEVVFNKFGNRVKYWITINEPKQICYEGYGSDEKAPALNMPGIAEYICAKNLLLAHAKIYHLYDKQFRKHQKGQIGITISCTWSEPLTDDVENRQAAVDFRRFDWGQYAHPIFSMHGDFPIELKRRVAEKSTEQGFKKSRLPELSRDEIDFIKGTSDFYGVNSYTTNLAYRNWSVIGQYAVPSYEDDMGAITIQNDSWPQAKSSWLRAVPWGFYKLLTEIRTLYDNPPIFITENGWSTGLGLEDDDRIAYYKGYLNAVLDAIEEGSDIRRYTAWSLIDNFEWKNGYTEKFGIYEVDFDSPNRTRSARKSAKFFKDLMRTRTLDYFDSK